METDIISRKSEKSTDTLMWFNYGDVTVYELDNSGISYFDICNVPVEYWGTDNIGVPRYNPRCIEMENYYVTFFRDHNSTTGYSCMCVNKSRKIYKAKIGY